jgi:hypothetical protein
MTLRAMRSFMAVVDVCHSQRRHDKICAAPSRNNFVTRWRMKRLFGHQSKLIVSKHEQYSSEKKLSSRVSGSQAPPLQKGKLGMTFKDGEYGSSPPVSSAAPTFMKRRVLLVKPSFSGASLGVSAISREGAKLSAKMFCSWIKRPSCRNGDVNLSVILRFPIDQML